MHHLLRQLPGLVAALSLASVVSAANIITIADSTPGSTGSFNIQTNRPLGVSWTQVQSFGNVTIEAAIGFPSTAGGSASVRAFLTTQIGPGTTQGTHQVADSGVITVPVTVPNVPQPLFTLFSGLSLGPGTYFLTVFAAPSQTSLGTSAWDGDVPTVTTDVGSTVNGQGFYAANSVDGTYAPASPFTLQTFGPGFLRVAGDAASSADLALTKTLTTVGTILVGSNAVFALTVTNNGPSNATGVAVTDALPVGLSHVSNDCGAAFASPILTWNVGALAVNASVSCNITVTVTQPGAIANSASAAGNETDPTLPNNTGQAVVTAQQSVLEIPTLDAAGLGALVALLAFAAALVLRRGRRA